MEASHETTNDEPPKAKQPGHWRIRVTSSQHAELRATLGIAGMTREGIAGVIQSADRARIERLIVVYRRYMTGEPIVEWIPPVGPVAARLGDEGPIHVGVVALLEWARATGEDCTPETRDRLRDELAGHLADAHRVGDEPDPKDIAGHTARYRARSRATGLDIVADVRSDRGVSVVEMILVRDVRRGKR